MSVEQLVNEPQPKNIEDQLLHLWETLPDDQKVPIVLTFLENIMQDDEQADYFHAVIADKWPLKTEQLEQSYPLIEVTDYDLKRVGIDGEDIVKLTPDQLTKIAQTIRQHYIYDFFWPELGYVAQATLEEIDALVTRAEPRDSIVAVEDEDFATWMEEVDRFVWILAGCSIHDLPDCKFRLLYDDGTPSEEMANEALLEAGFELPD